MSRASARGGSGLVARPASAWEAEKPAPAGVSLTGSMKAEEVAAVVGEDCPSVADAEAQYLGISNLEVGLSSFQCRQHVVTYAAQFGDDFAVEVLVGI